MRLDRYLSQASGYSRTEVKRLIKAGAVTVDGDLAIKAQSEVQACQAVILNGELLSTPRPVYIMMHKPADYLCATHDSQHPIVFDLLEQVPRDLQIVGRLDLDTTGLLLLTTDGQWNHRISSPKSACGKSYRVTLDSSLEQTQIDLLEQGVLLRGEKKPTRPCKIKPIAQTQFDVTIYEGKYHQIKRMFAHVGAQVVGLHRFQIGPIVLDQALQPGQYRELSQTEIKHF